MEKHIINLPSNRKIEFELIRKKVKNINLTVKPDMTISVSASLDTPIQTIIDYVKKKSSWIKSNVTHFTATKSENNISREYVGGETYKFMGNQYRLLVEYTTNQERVSIDNKYITLHVREKRKTTTRARLLEEFYRSEASKAADKSLEKMYPLISDKIGNKPLIDTRIMKIRWGSCLRAKNTILLNLEIIKAPKYCIDYVVLHELIHFVHKEHNSKFYELLSVLMPDWKKRKALLDEEIVLFI